MKHYLAASMTVSFLVGVIYILAAILRLGGPMASLLPEPVIGGFMQASAILVMASQVGTFLQISGPSHNSFVNIVASVFEKWDGKLIIKVCDPRMSPYLPLALLLILRCSHQLGKRYCGLSCSFR